MHYNIKKSVVTIFSISIVLLFGCDNNINALVDDTPSSSWEIIQNEILTPNCVTCHSTGTSFANQSGLVLSKDDAYTNLIDVVPANSAAASDGLKLLEKKGLESLYKSFFWEKINAPDQEHFHQDHPEYGEIMPFGSLPLTNGELAFIREWIIAGAPETEIVANVDLLADTSRFEQAEENFSQLEQPASGFQVHLGPFYVAPNYERELFEYQIIGNSEDIFVNRIEITMRKSSHHFIFYDFPPGAELPEIDLKRDVRDENSQYIISTLQSLDKQRFIFGTQHRTTDYSYPEGVALRISANKGFDLNSHYVNYTAQSVSGEVYVNLHTIDESLVQHYAEELFLSEQNFSLPPQQESLVTAEYIFNERRNIFMLNAHAHKHMKEFRIFISGGARDGELIYYTDNWQHPVLLDYEPPLVLNAGEGLRGEAIYDNNTDKVLRFGLLSVDEMMIIFGAYYVD